MRREIESIHAPIQTQEGAGVILNRLFPVAGLNHIDPLLLLDHFGSDNPDEYIAGFPLHPHRGIETITYMLEGRVRHRDSTGRNGIIGAGDVQWMCAGRGIMHEEMPEIVEGRLNGFQLWLNLPAKDKMKMAEYQEFRAGEITRFELDDHDIRLISGALLGHHGAVRRLNSQVCFADITLSKGELALDLPAFHTAIMYVFEGELEHIDDAENQKTIGVPKLIVLKKGEQLHLKCEAHARFLLISGPEINEPIVRSGPFVMNTRAEIAETWAEIQSGQFPPE